MAEQKELDPKKFQAYIHRNYTNENTREQYINCMNKYIRRVGSELNQDSFDKFISGKSLGYCNNILINRVFLKLLCDCFNIDIKRIKLPESRSQEEEHKLKYLTKEEIDNILQYLKKDINKYDKSLFVIVSLMFDTGLRAFEVMQLKLDNIDTEQRYVNGIGKRKKEFKLKYSEKTNTYLIEYLKENKFKKHPFYFVSNDKRVIDEIGYVKDQERKLWYELKKSCKKIPLDVTVHMIRHSLGHYLRVDKHFDLEQVRFKLRHKSVSTTQIYSLASEEEVDKKMEEEVFEKNNN
jgi:integrase